MKKLMEMKSKTSFLFLLLSTLNMVNFVIAEQTSPDIYRCKSNSGTFQPNSPYKTNLMSALNQLTSEITKNDKVPKAKGYGVTFAGEKQDEVTAIALCAGYIKLQDCVSCVNTTIQPLVQKCPNQKEAVAWRNKCMVRYEAFSLHHSDSWFVAHEKKEDKVKDAEGLEKTISTLVGNLIKKLYENQPLGYSFGTQQYGSPSQNLFMVMQCALDISSKECDKCLLQISKEMKPCCSGATAAAVYTPICYMRYAHQDFRTT